ncbi:MAG: ribosome biogenesis GTPase Der [Chloroflexi bacterium]|nr:ribosome biogenesis GTPase Der [Chloroflexota bacterium]
MAATRPVIAIIGRPNVGKSTLFNRLLGRRFSIISDVPGTTRDRVSLDAVLRERPVALVDSGGLAPHPTSAIEAKVQEQVRAAIGEADVLLFVVDAQTGLSPLDHEVADLVRRTGKPTVLVANKVDTAAHEAQASEFNALGLGEPICVSAYHGRGIPELLDRIEALLPPPPMETAPEPAAGLRIAIVGRPNVGKSMLLNALLGQERVIVSETPGTTRDSIDTQVTYQGETVTLIDTAGIRRSGRVEPGIEKFSVLRALQAIYRADVVVLVLDTMELPTQQDTHIAGAIQEQYKGVIVAVNKWDLAKEHNLTSEEATKLVQRRLKFLPYVPILFTSALTGKGVDQILPIARSIQQERVRRVPDAEVKSLLKDALATQAPPPVKGRRLRIFGGKQTGVGPPTFAIQVNDPNLVHFSYHRFLETRFRQRFGFGGTPFHLVFKKRERKAK